MNNFLYNPFLKKLIDTLLQGSLILCNFLSLIVHQYYIKSFEKTQKEVTAVIYLQRTDISFNSVDFDDPMSIISYFKKLCQSVAVYSEEDVDRVIDNIL